MNFYNANDKNHFNYINLGIIKVFELTHNPLTRSMMSREKTDFLGAYLTLLGVNDFLGA